MRYPGQFESYELFNRSVWLPSSKQRLMADEAFRDLLKKHNRPSDLKWAVRQSAEADAVKRFGIGESD
ncbi:MAG TPA: hypothetical protein VLJ17_21995 [Xanthobacteraceae bacterium]|jgi:hypothetical protein|nr:hypothetical protein [Xanthobacteraceae bacterium]